MISRISTKLVRLPRLAEVELTFKVSDLRLGSHGEKTPGNTSDLLGSRRWGLEEGWIVSGGRPLLLKLFSD